MILSLLWITHELCIAFRVTLNLLGFSHVLHILLLLRCILLLLDGKHLVDGELFLDLSVMLLEKNLKLEFLFVLGRIRHYFFQASCLVKI